MKRRKSIFKMASNSTRGELLEPALREKLPGIDDCIMEQLLDTLLGLGVTEMADLEYVTAEKLTPPLKEVQARKLLRDYSREFVAAREQCKLDKMEKDLKFIELQRGIEADKMKYKTEMTQAQAEIRKAITEQNNQIRNIAEKEANKEDAGLILSGASYGAGLGAAIGIVGGPLGMAAGAAIGAALVGGTSGRIATITREDRVERKRDMYSQQIADGQKMNMEMADNMENRALECKLSDISQTLVAYRKA